MSSPLFRNALKHIQDQARREFRRTTAGNLLTELEKTLRGGRSSQQKLKSLSRKLSRLSGRNILQELSRGTEVGRLVGDVQKYAKGSDQRRLLDEILGSLGPLGDLFQALLRPRGRSQESISLRRELAAAKGLLQAFGSEVIAPPGKRTGFTGKAKAAQELLESLGFTVTPPPAAKTKRPKPRRTRAGTPRKTVDIQIGSRKRRYRWDDPILSGEMITVASSNVHSIGFLFNHEEATKGTLKVRFLQQSRGRTTKGPGPLYHYYDVHPDVFGEFRKAASKGEFVWDRLRIRGTVSGHRFHYDLKGITGGHVPRKATRFEENEYFVGRRLKARSTRTYRTRTFESELPDRLVRRLGEPNRGKPNRGRASRER